MLCAQSRLFALHQGALHPQPRAYKEREFSETAFCLLKGKDLADNLANYTLLLGREKRPLPVHKEDFALQKTAPDFREEGVPKDRAVAVAEK